MQLKLLLFLSVSGCWCSCPQLKPNSNVIALCSNTTQPEITALGTSRRQYTCFNKNNTISARIPVGTIVYYKCGKYFKPSNTNNNVNGGIITCTEDGTWVNKKAFQNFYCEFDCGKQPALKNELITQGNATKAKNWPWVATIFRKTKDGNFKYSCGGTLIGQKTVLTAAHCVKDDGIRKLPNNNFRVFLGAFSSIFQEGDLKIEGLQAFTVKEIQVHRDYHQNTLSADIALIILNEDANLTDTVLPICLPRNYEQDALVIGAGNVGEISSFGIDSTGRPAKILQHAYIPVTSNARCNDGIGIIPHGDQFCGGNEQGPNICRGDSGSGIVFKSVEWNEEKYSIHGIVSNTGEVENGCAPMVIFAKVFTYVNWIHENLLAAESTGFRSLSWESSRGRKVKLIPGPGINLYTKAERTALKNIHPLVKDILLEPYMHNDEYLIRFLRTKGLNLRETKEMLETTMYWRIRNLVSDILYEDFTDMRKKFPVFFQGEDKSGRPVLTYLLGVWGFNKLRKPSEFEKLERYAIRNFEETEERIRAIGMPNITQTVIIIDYNGAVSRQFEAPFLRILAKLFLVYQFHYPFQVYFCYQINVTPVAASAVDAILPFASSFTSAMFTVFGTNKTEWSQELLKQIPADQLYRVYGGTKFVRKGTRKLQLTL